MYDLNCFVYVFLFHLRIVLTKLKILTLKVHISVFVIIIVLIQMKHGNWFNTTVCSASLDVTKTKARSASDNFMLWLITQSKGRTRKCIGKVSNLIRANVYLVLTSQVFKSKFDALIIEDYSIDVEIERYQSNLGTYFSFNTSIYILPSDLNLNIRKTAGFNYKIFRNTKKAEVYNHKSAQSQLPAAQLNINTTPNTHSMQSSDKPVKDAETIGNQKMLAEKRNDET